MVKDRQFSDAKEIVLENLQIIKESLIECVSEGMSDPADTLYNETLDLIESAADEKSWEGLLEIISRAKTLETDIAAYLAIHGRTSLSLPWPSTPKNS